MRKPTCPGNGEGRRRWRRSDNSNQRFRRGIGVGMYAEGNVGTREAPTARGRGSQLELREEQAGPYGVADRLVLPVKPGNAGGGKEPGFWRVIGRDQESGDWLCLQTP